MVLHGGPLSPLELGNRYLRVALASTHIVPLGYRDGYMLAGVAPGAGLVRAGVRAETAGLTPIKPARSPLPGRRIVRPML